MFNVYILFSASLGKYYIGSCGEDLDGRIRRHLSNHSGFAAKAKDWELVHKESFGIREDAYRRERQIKGWKSTQMIERLINAGD